MLYNDIMQKQSMQQSIWTAIIPLLPKPGKDHLDVNNYRPLSLLKNDYKLFAKILAKRLERLVLSQGDYYPTIWGDSCRLPALSNIQWLQYPWMLRKHLTALSGSTCFTLYRCGFGPRCLQWIRALYHDPMSAVKSYNIISAPFQLYYSTWQGCPLSPLLLILAWDPLACTMRLERNIIGVWIGDYDFKLNMYAGENLLTTSKPKIPKVLELWKHLSACQAIK